MKTNVSCLNGEGRTYECINHQNYRGFLTVSLSPTEWWPLGRSDSNWRDTLTMRASRSDQTSQRWLTKLMRNERDRQRNKQKDSNLADLVSAHERWENDQWRSEEWQKILELSNETSGSRLIWRSEEKRHFREEKPVCLIQYQINIFQLVHHTLDIFKIQHNACLFFLNILQRKKIERTLSETWKENFLEVFLL